MTVQLSSSSRHLRVKKLFPVPGGPYKQKFRFFTSELQGQLDHARFSFTEDFDGWQEVWGCAWFLVEEDTVRLLSGQCTIEDSEEFPLASGFCHDRFCRGR